MFLVRVVLLTFGRFLSLVQEAVMLEVHHESGGFAPWNFGSACLGGRNDRISVECLNLVHRGGVITLGGTIFHWGIMKEML
jgi:hypothetical protein